MVGDLVTACFLAYKLSVHIAVMCFCSFKSIGFSYAGKEVKHSNRSQNVYIH